MMKAALRPEQCSLVLLGMMCPLCSSVEVCTRRYIALVQTHIQKLGVLISGTAGCNGTELGKGETVERCVEYSTETAGKYACVFPFFPVPTCLHLLVSCWM